MDFQDYTRSIIPCSLVGKREGLRHRGVPTPQFGVSSLLRRSGFGQLGRKQRSQEYAGERRRGGENSSVADGAGLLVLALHSFRSPGVECANNRGFQSNVRIIKFGVIWPAGFLECLHGLRGSEESHYVCVCAVNGPSQPSSLWPLGQRMQR